MQRRHFELVAASIKEALAACGKNQEAISGVKVTAISLADSFEAINERFDRKRFLAACGI